MILHHISRSDIPVDFEYFLSLVRPLQNIRDGYAKDRGEKFWEVENLRPKSNPYRVLTGLVSRFSWIQNRLSISETRFSSTPLVAGSVGNQQYR